MLTILFNPILYMGSPLLKFANAPVPRLDRSAILTVLDHGFLPYNFGKQHPDPPGSGEKLCRLANTYRPVIELFVRLYHV